MAPIASSLAWKRYVDDISTDSTKFYDGGDQYFELEYNGRKLKYAVAVFGNQPESGYPLYIGLHGGGGESEYWKKSDNDGQWWGVFKDFYRGPVKDFATGPGGDGAVFVAARGISSLIDNDPNKPLDTYDLHSQPESFLLMQRLISNLLLPQPVEVKQGRAAEGAQLNKNAPHLVDPDKVYLLGFSAGGDGAYQLGCKLADRFAAVVAGGGHPNQAVFTNIAHTPLCLQCGEKDIVGTMSGRESRARVTIETADKIGLPAGAVTPSYWKTNSDDGCPPSWYHYECHIIKDGDHNVWASPGEVQQKQKVLTNLAAWWSGASKPGARDISLKVVNPTEWVSQYTRNSCPNQLVWDLSSRPPRYENFKPDRHQPERFFHWLYIRDPTTKDFNTKDVIFADYGYNFVRIHRPKEYLALLINESMIPNDRAFDIIIGDDSSSDKWRVLLHVAPEDCKPSQNLEFETLSARGDPRLMFSKMFYFEAISDGSWNVKMSGTLAVPVVNSKL